MIKQKIFLLITLAAIAAQLIYCWAIILSDDLSAQSQHYLAVVLFAVVIFLYFKKIPVAIAATGIFLLLGTFNAFSMTPEISKTQIWIGSLKTPYFNSVSLGFFALFFVLNFNTLVNLYLDQKEAKQAKK